MSYAGQRRIIDADSHVIELDDFLWNAAEPSERALLPAMADQSVLPVSAEGLAQRDREVVEHFRRRSVPLAIVRPSICRR